MQVIHPVSAFYRQSLQIQHLHAELYHNATALRGIDGPEDVQSMLAAQRELAIKSIKIGRQILDITVNSPSYREGMKYGQSHSISPAYMPFKDDFDSCTLYPRNCYLFCIIFTSIISPFVSSVFELNF